MSLLRFLAVAALAVWIGGLVALGAIGAPVLFSQLQALVPATGRELAGQVFGAIFARFQYLSWALGAVALLSLSTRAILGPRPRRFGIRMWLVAGMLATSLVTVFFVTPRIDAIRESVKGPVASLPDTDPRKSSFGRLHGVSNGLMVFTVLAGLGLLWMESRDQH